tara:strand:- start:49 stop:282 length:234 start_codon:yes stop_codon:yes gene_type:complete
MVSGGKQKDFSVGNLVRLMPHYGVLGTYHIPTNFGIVTKIKDFKNREGAQMLEVTFFSRCGGLSTKEISSLEIFLIK